MDVSKIGSKLRPADVSAVSDAQWQRIVRKAKEHQRMCSLKFDASAFGIGELAKAVLCLELAATSAGTGLDRRAAAKASGLSEKAYNNSIRMMHNALGIRVEIDIRKLGIQFGCVRVVEPTKSNLAEFISTFKTTIPEERREAADFSRPVFTAAAFYLTARKHQLKVDRPKLIEVTSTSEEELKRMTSQMQELCPRVFGPRSAVGQKRPLDAGDKRQGTNVPNKRKDADGEVEDSADEGSFEAWKERMRREEGGQGTATESSNGRKLKQAKLDFIRT